MPALLCLLLACAPFARAQGPSAADDASVLVLGRVSDDPKAHYDQLKPLLDYVIPRMADGRHPQRSHPDGQGPAADDQLPAPRPGRLDHRNRRQRRCCWSIATSPAPLLLTEREGASRYHSLFFVRRDSAGAVAATICAGRSVAFQSPLSTSAYFVPAAQLLEGGQSLEMLLSPMDQPAPDRVGYVFARSELNIATWVHKRLVDAGVLSNLDWDQSRADAAGVFRRISG